MSATFGRKLKWSVSLLAEATRIRPSPGSKPGSKSNRFECAGVGWIFFLYLEWKSMPQLSGNKNRIKVYDSGKCWERATASCSSAGRCIATEARWYDPWTRTRTRKMWCYGSVPWALSWECLVLLPSCYRDHKSNVSFLWSFSILVLRWRFVRTGFHLPQMPQSGLQGAAPTNSWKEIFVRFRNGERRLVVVTATWKHPAAASGWFFDMWDKECFAVDFFPGWLD